MLAADTFEALNADAQRLNADPAWFVMDKVSPLAPQSRALAHIWRFSKMRPLLERAARVVDQSQAERRVLMLTNPGIGRFPFTADTIYAGLQIILPGERARPHRHIAFALRFIIEGEGAHTSVNGERVNMNAGDLILTPSWAYHDHGNKSGEPMIWLDGLDTPLYQFLPVHFTEQGNAFIEQQPALTIPLRFPWAKMQAELDARKGAWCSVPYEVRPGVAISATIGAQAERLAPGGFSPKRRETATAIYHVRRGSGASRIGDEILSWVQGDTFVVPPWTWYSHQATDAEAAYLFRYDDSSLITHIGAYRCETNTDAMPAG